GRRYPGVRPEDLSFMAPMAVQRAETETEKIAVCEAVGRCLLKSAMPDVAKLLKDDPFMVRANAIAAIRDAGAREYAGDIRRLLGDAQSVVRSVAAHALGRMGATEAAPDLVKLLRDKSSDVRWWAIRALGDLNFIGALEEIEGLQADPDASVCRVAKETAAALRKKP